MSRRAELRRQKRAEERELNHINAPWWEEDEDYDIEAEIAALEPTFDADAFICKIMLANLPPQVKDTFIEMTLSADNRGVFEVDGQQHIMCDAVLDLAKMVESDNG